jgi:phage tail-like protein
MSKATPHYLLNGLAGWRAGSLSGAVLAGSPGAAGGPVLTLQPLPGSARPLVDASGSLGGFESAIGVAVDCEDRVYILDGKAGIVKRFDRCLGQFITLPCLGGCGSEPRQLSAPNGMAISRRNDLYIADTGNRRVQIFALQGLALRAIWEPLLVKQSGAAISVTRALPVPAASGPSCETAPVYPAQTWSPWDVAIAPNHWVYFTDYANGLVHLFDPQGCWRCAFTGAGANQPQLVKPTRIAIDLQGQLYILQEGQSYVVVLDAQGNYLGQVTAPAALQGRFSPVAAAVDAQGNLCLSDCLTRKLYFYESNGDGGWCPSPGSGCANSFAASITFDRCGNPIVADGAGSVCQLTPQAAYPLQGVFYTAALDSKTYLCTWHRVALRARVPSGCTLRVDTLTSESVKTSEEILGLPESRWTTGQVDADPAACDWDCLIQGPPGRYLWLRLTLGSEGPSTPCVEQVKVYYPRASSLKYLPAVYREDAVSADFLARFLSIFDTMSGQTSQLISVMARYFDPKATPANQRNQGGADFLSWLASWLGLSLEANWPVEKRRELVRKAHLLFALRGTPEGLKLQIEIFAGVKPRILELFRLRRWLLLNQASLGNTSTLFGS